MERLRVGIIGAGGIVAKMHLPEMQTVPNASVTVISGRRQSRLERLSDHFNIPFYTRNYEKVVNDPKVDAVIIALPHPLHVEWGLKALQAGKHVYMQKPLCINMEEADQFVRAVELSDRIVFCLPHLSPPAHPGRSRVDSPRRFRGGFVNPSEAQSRGTGSVLRGSSAVLS